MRSMPERPRIKIAVVRNPRAGIAPCVKSVWRTSPERKKAAGHMIRQPYAGVYAGGVDPRWLCVAEEWGAARLRIAADPENLYRILIFAAAHGAAVCDQHAGRIEFKGVNARQAENMGGLALLPHNRRTATSAFHIQKFRVITLAHKGAAQWFGNGLERVVMHHSLPQAPAHVGRAYDRGCGASFKPYLP